MMISYLVLGNTTRNLDLSKKKPRRGWLGKARGLVLLLRMDKYLALARTLIRTH